MEACQQLWFLDLLTYGYCCLDFIGTRKQYQWAPLLPALHLQLLRTCCVTLGLSTAITVHKDICHFDEGCCDSLDGTRIHDAYMLRAMACWGHP
jgi:hypothetical protein